MKKIITITVLLVLIISLASVAYYTTTIQASSKMMTRLLSHFPEGYGNPDDAQTWEVIIMIRQRKLEDMANPGYKDREQKKMEQMGFDIELTDEMVQSDRKQLREEVQFAQDQLDRIQYKENR